MRPTRPSAVQIAAFSNAAPVVAGGSRARRMFATLRSYAMNAPSFLKRLVGSVVPSERRRTNRRARHAVELCQALLSERGEVSGAVIARDALAAYNALPKTALASFFDTL